MFSVSNRAEDGTYHNEFATLVAALEYVTYQTSIDFSSPADLATVKVMIAENGYFCIHDDWGREFTVEPVTSLHTFN